MNSNSSKRGGLPNGGSFKPEPRASYQDQHYVGNSSAHRGGRGGANRQKNDGYEEEKKGGRSGHEAFPQQAPKDEQRKAPRNNNFNSEEHAEQYDERGSNHQSGRGSGRGYTRGTAQINERNGHHDRQNGQDPNEFQPANNLNRGRGRGRGQSYQTSQDVQISAHVKGFQQYDTNQQSNNTQFYNNSAPPFVPSQISSQQWVGDFKSYYPQQVTSPTPVDNHPLEQPKLQQTLSSSFRPGQPGVIHYARQPKTREQRAVHSNSMKSQITATQDRFLQQQPDFKNTFDDVNEEKKIQDTRTINVYQTYKDYQTPDFFQAPTYIIFKEQSKIKNHKYPENKVEEVDDENIYHVASTPPTKPPRDSEFSKKKNAIDNGLSKEEFDIKIEKRLGNRFWREVEKAVAIMKKKDKKTVISTTTQATKGGRQGKKDRKVNKVKDRKEKKQAKTKVLYEEFIQFEDQITKGIQEGKFFKGLLRVNPNNRSRGFVSIEGVSVDVMIDGLDCQNRALDGDTVVIQLLNPSRWPSLTTGNIIIGGKLWEQKGITNDTAVETRVIDAPKVQKVSQEEAKIVRYPEVNFLGELQDVPLAIQDSTQQQSNQTSEEQVSPNEEIKEEMFTNERLVDTDTESEDNEDKPKNPFRREKQPKDLKSSSLPLNPKKRIQQQMSFIVPAGTTRKEIIALINEHAQDCRPLGRVKAILNSPNRDREQMVTLTVVDKERLDDDSFLSYLIGDINIGKNNPYVRQKIAMNSGIYAVPVSKKLPWMSLMNIPPEFIEDLKNEKKPQNRYYTAKFQSWNVGFVRPLCQITGQIGEAGNLNAESLRILKTHDVWCDEYEPEGQKLNEKVHESLRVFTKNIDETTGEWKIPEEEVKLRMDLRHRRIFTIDPVTAKDLDDALSIEHIEDSIYEIGVHIADVSYFVQQGTDLDREAQLRCTSVYFVHKVYPMLPRLLCERLCSLNPQVDRLSYSIFFMMDMATGEVVKEVEPQLTRSIMRSCAKWNYQLVQDILDKKITSVDQLEEKYRPKEHSFEDMVNDCFLMHELAQKRRKIRLANGSITLSNREFMFKLDPETMLPQSFQEQSTQMASKHLVEEYMLLANILVAEHLFKYCKDKTLLRAHPDLDKDKKELLMEFFERAGLKGLIDLTNSKSVSHSLEALRATGDSSKYNVALRKFLTCLQCAKYMCINESSPEDYQHFGLNFQLYTHFTSPIRRYADLLVHRLVTLTLTHKDKTRDLIELMDYSEFAEQCSEKSLNAKRASTQCTRLFHCLLIKSQGVRAFETLLFDMEVGGILSIYINEVHMHHKVRLRDDSRIDNIIFFEKELITVALIKNVQESHAAKAEAFKDVTKLEQLNQFDKEDLLIFKIFDKVKVKVDTTTEFPLDIKCSLLFNEEDLKEYAKLNQQQEDSSLISSTMVTTNKREKVLGEVVEIENLDADV